MVVERLHGKIKTAVFREKSPGLHVSVRLWKSFNIHSTDFMSFAVVKDAGFGCIAFISDTPGYFKAEKVLFTILIQNPAGTIPPVPYQCIWGADPSPVQNAEGIGFGKSIAPFGRRKHTGAGHAVLLCCHEVTIRKTFKRKDRCNVFKPGRNIHLKFAVYIPVLITNGTPRLSGVDFKESFSDTKTDMIRDVSAGRKSVPILTAYKWCHA